jgi:hypothetical protein
MVKKASYELVIIESFLISIVQTVPESIHYIDIGYIDFLYGGFVNPFISL